MLLLYRCFPQPTRVAADQGYFLVTLFLMLTDFPNQPFQTRGTFRGTFRRNLFLVGALVFKWNFGKKKKLIEFDFYVQLIANLDLATFDRRRAAQFS